MLFGEKEIRFHSESRRVPSPGRKKNFLSSNYMKTIGLSTLIVMILAGLFFMSCQTTTYYIVRHAEKLNETANTPLSDAGLARANVLKDTLLNKKIKYIFVSDKLRTQQTAQPTADAFDLSFTTFLSTPAGTLSLIQQLQTYKSTYGILVVGHSNTVPQIIDSLMKAPQHITIGENDFDNLYVVKISKGPSVGRTLKIARYGAVSP